jgi:hypothetical protein
MFRNIEANVQQMIDNKKILQENLSNDLCSELKEIFIEQIKIFDNQINDIKKNKRYNIYLLESVNIINNYKKILNTPKRIDFMTSTSNSVEIEKKRTELESMFLNIANKYIDIEMNNKNNKNNSLTCENCGYDLYINTSNTNNLFCDNCSMEISTFHSSSFSDSDRVNISTKYSYDKNNHFRECINQYTGEQNVNIPSEIYDHIYRQIKFHKIPVVEGKYPYKNIAKNVIFMFLKDGGYSKHYENINLIYNTITGKKPIDISHLKEKLVSDFDKLTQKYTTLFPNNKRKNFLNTQYILFQLLKRHDHICEENEFATLKTLDRKLYHENIIKVLFESLGWNYTSIF